MAEFDTADGFTDAATFRLTSPLSRVTLTIQNADAVIQFTTVEGDLRPSAYNWNTVEYPLIPGVWTFDARDLGGNDIAAVRARSKVAGTPAHVAVLA